MNNLKFTLGTSILCIISASALAGPPIFRLVDIGFLPDAMQSQPTGINSNGVVSGTAHFEGGIAGFVWSEKTGIQRLPVPRDGRRINYSAKDINDRGQVVGYVPAGAPSGGGGPAIWNPSGGYTFFLDGTWAAARPYNIVQITNSGQVLGESYIGSDGNTDTSPWFWSEKLGLVDIVDIIVGGADGYRVNQMNNKGQIVGFKYNNCRTEAFLYDGATRKILWLDPRNHGTACQTESHANAINDLGQVIGWNRMADIQYARPFIWSQSDGLKILSGSSAPNRTDVIGTDINNSGQVVGQFQLANQFFRTSFFYWDAENGFHDLKKLLDPADPLAAEVVLQTDNGGENQEFIPKINDRGQIVLTGSLRGEDIQNGPRHTFVLMPIAPCRATTESCRRDQ